MLIERYNTIITSSSSYKLSRNYSRRERKTEENEIIFRGDERNGELFKDSQIFFFSEVLIFLDVEFDAAWITAA